MGPVPSIHLALTISELQVYTPNSVSHSLLFLVPLYIPKPGVIMDA